MVLFQKPADPQPSKPAVAPPPAPVQPTPAPNGQPGKESIKVIDDPTFLTRPPAALQREKVFQQFNSDDQLRKRVTHELAEEQLVRDLKTWEEKKNDDPTKGPKPTYEMVLARKKFPETPPPGKPGEAYVTKAVRESYPPARYAIEPVYVVHRRLYYEELNSERYGWDTGFAQPLVSTLAFYKDVLLWPAKLASYPCDRYDASAGKCLPGSPVPYLIYPQEISLFGATVGAATIVGTAGFVFP